MSADDQIDGDEKSFGSLSNSQHEKTVKEINQGSQVRIDFDLELEIEEKEIKIDFPKDNQDSNSNYSENVTSEKNLYDLMGSIKDQIWYQSKFLKQNHHFRPR